MKNLWSLSNSYSTYTNPTKITKAQYMKLMGDFFWELSYLIIREKYQFRFPRGIGLIRIKKRKNNPEFKKNKIDYGHYNKTGKLVRFTNSHSDNYYFRFYWDKSKGVSSNFKNKNIYTFVPIRGNDRVIGARGLAKYIKDCANDPFTKDYDCPE